MKANRELTAVFEEETGAIKCGHCGKTLCFFEENKKKTAKKAKISQKSIDNGNFFAIIYMKCERCKTKNTHKI